MVLGIQGAGELDGAQHARLEIHAEALELVLQEAVVEARIVGDEEAALDAGEDFFGDVGEARRAAHHVVGDADEALDERTEWIRPDRPG